MLKAVSSAHTNNAVTIDQGSFPLQRNAWERRSQSYLDTGQWERHSQERNTSFRTGELYKNTQFAPKFAYLRSKIENFYSSDPFPIEEGDTPSSHPTPPPRRLDSAPTVLLPHLPILEPPLFVSHTSFLGNDSCDRYDMIYDMLW